MIYLWVVMDQSLQVKTPLLSLAAYEILWEIGKENECWLKEMEMGK